MDRCNTKLALTANRVEVQATLAYIVISSARVEIQAAIGRPSASLHRYVRAVVFKSYPLQADARAKKGNHTRSGKEESYTFFEQCRSTGDHPAYRHALSCDCICNTTHIQNKYKDEAMNLATKMVLEKLAKCLATFFFFPLSKFMDDNENLYASFSVYTS